MKALLKYLRPHWKYAVLAPLLMFLEVTCDLMQPNMMAKIVNEVVDKGQITNILRMGGTMILISLVGLIGGLGCTFTSSMASAGFGTDLRGEVFKKVQKFSFANLDRFKTASLITRLTNDIVQVQNIVLMSLRMLVRAPLLCIGGIIMAVSINAKLGIILLIATPLLSISIINVVKRGFPLFGIVQRRLDKLNDVIRENLSGVRVIKAFVRADLEKNRFKEANDGMVQVSLKAGRLMMLTMPIMMIIMNFSVVAVIWFGGLQVSKGTMNVGEVMAFINYLTQILFSLMMVTMMIMNYSRAKVSADRIGEVLEANIDIIDSEAASEEVIQNGKVVFENVSFRYPGAGGDPVLKNISFTANPGETVAILGATGVGKSSLVNLIPRLYDVTEGRVLIDGTDVRDIKLTTLRNSVSVVLQESILFSGTIRDNLLWGKEEATEEEIIEAAQAAQAHEFITKFPEGYQTIMGQKGVNVSGGQKQRISIARAIIKKPPILILDDSTSAVDITTEARIQKAFKKLMKNTTCIVIAQRISTVLEADKIIVLENGEISAIGNHEELLKCSPVYEDIYMSQIGREAVSNG
jgi:ATP-binding cassette subfamily B multidrug efflux pump